MKFQLFSDIHTELTKNKFYKIIPQCDYLFLAGDIGKVTLPNFKNFIKYCSNNWKKVIYVMGNHEFYGKRTINSILDKFITFFNTFPNVYLLNNSSIIIDDITLYGFTGWIMPIFENSSTAREYLNDYNMIKTENGKLRVEDHKNIAINQINKFKYFIDNNDSEKIIIITHFPPIRNNTSNPLYTNDILKEYYSWPNMLENLNIETNKIKLWCSGHTHWSYDFILNNIRYISNQI